MKQLLFCYKEGRDLLVRHSILTDVFVPVQDIISPQKATLKILKTSKVELGDIIIIRDNKSGVVEYIGYVETLSNKINTEISCYPLINIFDNDYVLDQMYERTQQEKLDEDGKVVVIDGKTQYEEVDNVVDVPKWINTQLTRAFIDTDDDLQALPLIIRYVNNEPVFYQKVIDTSNLFEVYVDLFINTGVYILFRELKYDLNKITGIYCDIYCNKDEVPYELRYDNPLIQNVDIVDNTFTNYNKIIATEELPEDATEDQIKNRKRYYFYLLDNNAITTEPDDNKRRLEEMEKDLKEGSLGRRIKLVRSKEKTFTIDEGKTDEENANALIVDVSNDLQAPEYNLQITIEMFNNDKIRLYRRVDFIADSGIIYSSNITKIEILNDKQVRVTLGALRNSLTDFKKKVEAI